MASHAGTGRKDHTFFLGHASNTNVEETANDETKGDKGDLNNGLGVDHGMSRRMKRMVLRVRKRTV